MTTNIEEIRFLCVEGNTWEGASRISGLMGSTHKAKFINYYFPGHNEKLIVFQFTDIAEKEKFLSIPELETELRKIKCKLYKPNTTEDPNLIHRQVFVYGMNGCYFYRYNKEDGSRETLDERLEKFMNHLKEALPEEAIENHRYIQHLDYNGTKKAPRTMVLTFKSLPLAEDFLKTDTHFYMGVIRARHKAFNKHIPIKQCSVCRKTDHRKGDTRCDRVARCARCLSPRHTVVQPACIPTCWEHSRGHSSGSERCDINIRYKKQQRMMLANKEKIAKQTEATPEEFTTFHQDLLRVENTLKSKTYAAATKSAQTPNQTAPRTVHPIQGATINTAEFACCYTAACIIEAYCPGSFQKEMDKFAQLNNFPNIKYPVPEKKVLRAMVPVCGLKSTPIDIWQPGTNS